MPGFMFVLGIFSLFFTSCGDFRKKIQSVSSPEDALVVLADNEVPIACLYFDPQNAAYGQGLSLFKQPWVWAQVEGYSNLVAIGTEQDGFFVADKIYPWGLIKKAGPTIDDSPGSIKKICQDSIDKKHPNKSFKLYKVEAFKSLVNTEGLPLVSGEKKTGDAISRIVIFGDSLSDNGNLFQFTKGFPAIPYFFGRFSNGPAWNDYLSSSLNIPVNNWAYGGAVTALNIGHRIQRGEVLGELKDRVINYLTGNLNDYVSEYLAALPGHKITSPGNTLFVIWAGGNDYLYNILISPENITQMIDQPDSANIGSNYLVTHGTKGIAAAIKKLYESGARNFLVANLPNIGTAPLISEPQIAKYREGDKSLSLIDRQYLVSSAVTNIIKLHNQKLAEEIAKLKSLKDINILTLDAYSALENVLNRIGPQGEPEYDYRVHQNRSRYLKFKDKPTIKVASKCFTGTYVSGGSAKNTCANPKNWLFWDFVHPTTTGHCIIGYYINKVIYDAGLLKNEPNLKTYLDSCN